MLKSDTGYDKNEYAGHVNIIRCRTYILINYKYFVGLHQSALVRVAGKLTLG